MYKDIDIGCVSNFTQKQNNEGANEMKEQVLEKIEELYDKYYKHYCELNTELEENKDNIYTESYNDLYYDYNGESISHILDIYDEKMEVLGILKRFIEKIEK